VLADEGLERVEERHAALVEQGCSITWPLSGSPPMRNTMRRRLQAAARTHAPQLLPPVRNCNVDLLGHRHSVTGQIIEISLNYASGIKLHTPNLLD
jgi:hypothetical protein